MKRSLRSHPRGTSIRRFPKELGFVVLSGASRWRFCDASASCIDPTKQQIKGLGLNVAGTGYPENDPVKLNLGWSECL